MSWENELRELNYADIDSGNNKGTLPVYSLLIFVLFSTYVAS